MDWSEVLDRLGGDQELLEELAAIFLEHAPVILSEIQRAISEQDMPALQNAAHSLKGSAGNFGAEEVIEKALALETMARERRIEQIEETFEALKVNLQQFTRELDGLI